MICIGYWYLNKNGVSMLPRSQVSPNLMELITWSLPEIESKYIFGLTHKESNLRTLLSRMNLAMSIHFNTFKMSIQETIWDTIWEISYWFGWRKTRIKLEMKWPWGTSLSTSENQKFVPSLFFVYIRKRKNLKLKSLFAHHPHHYSKSPKFTTCWCSHGRLICYCFVNYGVHV